MATRVPVTFAPGGATAWAAPGTTLSAAAQAAGVLLAAPCGGRGVCGGCGVRVVSGALEAPDEIEQHGLVRAPPGVRLACRARVCGPVEVRPLYAEARPRAEAPQSRADGIAVGRLVAGVDLGTTSVAALLVDADSGKEIGRASVPNRQATFGADVLSRISAALAGESGRLRTLAEESVVEALRDASDSAALQLSSIERLVVAANSTMSALLVGADAAGLAAHPFVAPTGGDALPADSAVRAMLAESAEATLVPAMAAFVGGDALAATIASGLLDSDAPRLLVDLGTNAELVLARPSGVIVASTAAGPAFEGVGIACGGPAADGAVDRVRIAGESALLHAIGDAEPRWFSGAGLISALAALRRAGHIDVAGNLVSEGPLKRSFARDASGVLGVRLSEAESGCVVLSQLDVRALQLAKAAVRAGIEALLSAGGITAADLAEVLVAGAFGAAVDPGDLIALGVLPANTGGAIRQIGNAALTGAAAMALDAGLETLAEKTAASVTHLDLAADPAFAAGFVSATELREYTA